MTGSIVSVATELRQAAERSADASGYFPAMYSGVTARLAARVGAGGFTDGGRMEHFACDFAARYLAARRGTGEVPACWRAAFGVADDPSLLIVQHLLLGINAHVNHDLPLAVVAVADQYGSLAGVRADFDTVNDVLAAQQTQVLSELGRVSRWINVAAGLGGGQLFHFSLGRARAEAWGAAERLWVLDDVGRRSYVAELDRLVAALAYLITRPRRPLSLVTPLLRRLEDRQPRRVTAALLRSAS